MKNHLASKYFKKNTQSLLAKNKRELDAKNEILTFEKLIQIYANLNIFKQKKKIVILDAGCGDQHLRSVIESKGWVYYGIDIDSTNFEIDSIKIKSKTIDFFISLAVIEHLSNPSKFLSEAHRTLKPGGLIYLSTPNFSLCYKKFYDDPTHCKPYTPTGLKYLLEIFHFKNVQTFPGTRAKPTWYYVGRFRFLKAFFLLPFRNDFKFAPRFLKGHSTSFFCIGRK
jgi:2-polyprenyl-3-methyl-5-hydroxy-6-metoxy-1,4-benzoquinol methylase